jgi:hypothetical protein
MAKKTENPRAPFKFGPDNPWLFAQDIKEMARNWPDEKAEDYFVVVRQLCDDILQRRRGRPPDIEGAIKTVAEYKASGAKSFNQFGKLKEGDSHDGREARRKQASRAFKRLDDK